MAENSPDLSGKIGHVILGATKAEGGTRTVSYHPGGESDLPFLGMKTGEGSVPLVAFEICDDPDYWSPIVTSYVGDLVKDTQGWAGAAEKQYGADLVRLYLTSTKRRGFDDFPAITKVMEGVLSGTGLPLVIEGSNEPAIDSEVFQRCGEAGQGERLLLGTA
ncbi:MAG: acetyl-CoA synthase, partial [Methanomicrobiales archaeon]